MPEDQSKPIRRTVHFSGCVQGVGFRYTAQCTASRFPVTGFVRNLSDGRVELVAEGTSDALDRFQEAVVDALRSYIDKASATNGAATGEFGSFRITL